ncbi:hypothetical protein TH606_03165 [Thermodesulfatator autotrophicus]|uniref:Cytochrome c-552/4 domain-containing protein n=2 Tax=Thermodesulfatator autotrophicus TaxID=1795632 RepID=A0A177E870_9BACT|nr:hypothetical protein TH606_03165 [Thermodesulfatator autotrophicus]
MKIWLFCFVLLWTFPIWASEEELRFPSKPIDDLQTFIKTYSSERCADCHEDVYKQWKESYHSRSMVSSIKGITNFFLVGVPKEWEKELTKKEILKCLDCHLPQIKYATERLAIEIAELMITARKAKGAEKEKAIATLSKLNLSCYGCHNIKVASSAPGITGEIDPNVIYTANEDVEAEHETDYHPALKRSVFCMQCHGVYHAPDGESIYCNTLSRSYADNYLGQGGRKSCQECHMYQKNRGHRMPGGHDLEIVKEGIELQAEIQGFRYGVGKWVPAVNVEAFLTNKAGHRVPDG